MKFIRKLPEASELRAEFPLDESMTSRREAKVKEIQRILDGKDNRKMLLVGPCSADREDAVIEYVTRLAQLQEKVAERFLLVPRVYTSKPRTKGVGYKGILHNPNPENPDDIWEGIRATRKLHLRVIQESGLFAVDEMLYPEEIYYILDLLAYLAVGARSVENQEHRMVASGVEIPVGLKNPTSGNKNLLINSINAAQSSHHMMYHGCEVETEGNPYAHAILRGRTSSAGKDYPNYHYEDLCELYDLYQLHYVKKPAVIIDCNHANSGKKYMEEIRVAKEVAETCGRSKELNRFVKGLMIESYLEDGCQLVGERVFGKSITDACLGWDKTERLILELAELI